MRLMARSTVVLPQPDGPTSAVTWFATRGKLTRRTAWTGPKSTATSVNVTAAGAPSRSPTAPGP